MRILASIVTIGDPCMSCVSEKGKRDGVKQNENLN